VSKAKFIVFEGIDGSGKTTLSKMLQDYFEKNIGPTHWTCEPTHNSIGKIIRSVLKHDMVMGEQAIAALYLADRLDHIHHDDYGMKHKIEQGTHVISDRYYMSSYAYHVPHVSLEWVINANSICADALKPDIIFYIDIDVETSMNRLAKSRESQDLFETEERITQVHQNYWNAIKRIRASENVEIIDGRLPIDEVFQTILSKL